LRPCQAWYQHAPSCLPFGRSLTLLREKARCGDAHLAGIVTQTPLYGFLVPLFLGDRALGASLADVARRRANGRMRASVLPSMTWTRRVQPRACSTLWQTAAWRGGAGRRTRRFSPCASRRAPRVARRCPRQFPHFLLTNVWYGSMRDFACTICDGARAGRTLWDAFCWRARQKNRARNAFGLSPWRRLLWALSVLKHSRFSPPCDLIDRRGVERLLNLHTGIVGDLLFIFCCIIRMVCFLPLALHRIMCSPLRLACRQRLTRRACSLLVPPPRYPASLSFNACYTTACLPAVFVLFLAELVRTGSAYRWLAPELPLIPAAMPRLRHHRRFYHLETAGVVLC